MSYKPIRKDLTEIGEDCHFCNTKLRSLKAYVLQNIDTGLLVMAGPVCAKRHISDEFTLKGLPDLTKFTSATGHRESGGGGGAGGGSTKDSERRRAIEYLQLREEKLTADVSCSWHVLTKHYQSYLKGELSEIGVNHINNIEKKAPDGLKLAVLQKCYNYLFWIDVALSKVDTIKSNFPREFLSSIRRLVVARKTLTPLQFKKLNEVLSQLDGIPQLK